MRWVHKKRRVVIKLLIYNPLFCVGVNGFEPSTPCSQSVVVTLVDVLIQKHLQIGCFSFASILQVCSKLHVAHNNSLVIVLLHVFA